jgi:hypothetical protein
VRQRDAVTKDIISVNDDVADVDTDAEGNIWAGTPSVPLRHFFLNRHRTHYGVDGAGKFNQHSIAGRFYNATSVRSDCRIKHLAPVGLQCLKGADLVRAHKSSAASTAASRRSTRVSFTYPPTG